MSDRNRLRRIAVGLAGAFLAASLIACGGEDDGSEDGLTAATVTSAPPGASTDTPDSTAGSTGPGSEATPAESSAGAVDLDVCSLLTQEEVEAAIGQPAGAPAFTPLGEAFAAQGLGGGDCRFEADGITPVVALTVLIWRDAETARSSFEFGSSSQAVEGIGDGARSTQPIGEISVLSGHYEVSLDIYFASEDDDAEFEMARELVEIAVSRLP